MSIKERYKELTQKELTLNEFQDIVELKNQCKIEMNQEYLYLCDILIIDLYINENLYDDALTIALKGINSIDNVVFQKIYVSFLERVIYIFIQKKNYKSAYRYAFLKRNYIDIENIDEVNRWYLEMAYIYAELNQKDKALLNLKAIINNNPIPSLKALTLSNMTKLYIDQKMISEAKNSLSDCITLVYQLDDEEGIMYCDYLNAKLYVLENNFKLAKQCFQDLFKNIHTLTDDYLSIANEYISLLIDMDLYDEAYRISIKYLKAIEKTNDLEIKKDYYKNYLKIYILKNKNVRDDLRQLLKAIEVLELEIDKDAENIINESNEDDKNLEVASKLREVINKIEKSLNIINIALKNDNIRDSIIEYSKQLEEIIKFDEALYVIFAKSEFDVLPEIFDDLNKVDTYNYKKQRLYEREYSFNNLNGTIVEMLIASNHEVIIDFNDSIIPVKDLISGKTYHENNVKTLIAIPLTYEKEMYGCAIYLSNDNSFSDIDVMVNLRIATKQLEFKLLSLFYLESLRIQKNIIQTTINEVKEGIFYLDPVKRKVILTDSLASFFKVSNHNLSKEEYLALINDDDKKIYQNIDKFIELGEPYHIEYRLNIGNLEALVCEKASPYITRDGVIKFYVGSISLLENAIVIEKSGITHIYNEDKFLSTFEKISNKAHDLEYKCTFTKFKIFNLNEYDLNIQEKIIQFVYSIIKENYAEQTFIMNDNSFMGVIEINDQKVIDKKVKTIFNILDQGIIFDAINVEIDIKASVVKFPKDTYNFQEIIEYCEIGLNSIERYQVFNDELKKNYLKKKSITTCVTSQIKRNEIELLFIPLKANDTKVLNTKVIDTKVIDTKVFDTKVFYEVKYNITGLLPNDTIYEHIDKNLGFNFEKLVLKTLLSQIKDNDAKYYLHISTYTIECLLKENFLKNHLNNLYQRIVLCIDDYSEHLDKIIKYLYNFGFKVNINYRIVNKISLSTLLNDNINGLFLDDIVEDISKILSIAKSLNLELLTNQNISDYQYLIYRTKEFVKIK